MLKKSFKDTLNLPKTDFSIRASAVTKEPELLKRWQTDDLYNKSVDENKETGKTFTLHDGPPFANGHMHMGHALNRTLKDIVCKAKRMNGKHVISIPGWDCHGLPIELKVASEIGKEDVRTHSTNAPGEETVNQRVEFKKKCREYANKWIAIQKEEIQRLGVISDWDHPYITMSPEYEGAILKAFADFVEKGYIERKGKTVPWCASCQTVLATAEIEYKDRKDPSCYILFELEDGVNLLVWTTTPWTIPLNRAVVMHPSAEYVVLQGSEKGQDFIVGAELADKVCDVIGIKKKVLKTLRAKDFEGAKVKHPFIDGLTVPIILDSMVLLDEGTACVHSAPGCGPEDYVLGIKNNLEIFSPLSSDGKYTDEIQPDELVGMSVEDGQIWSIKEMAKKGRLLYKTSIRHSYPHCWRCHNPLIFRATDQWFCDLKKNDIVNRSIAEAEKLSFIPEWGKVRLTSSMASRSEWCLSRQRQWGVPIPALLCNKCDHPYLSADMVRDVADHVSKEGIEYWDTVSVEEFSPSCQNCGNNDLKEFRKETDILDVWFESGVSHTAVKAINPRLPIPVDVYLEGSDQHRGWFQSSLLSSMIMYDKTCTKSFVTHAFVLDESAMKMSKSKGNVISPEDIMKRYSADILRLWVASANYEDDIIISETVLKNVSEVYRKIRNTCRFMISNLYDFDIGKDAVALENLTVLDQHAMAQLQNVIEVVKKAYEEYKFTTVYTTLNEYCTNELSSFYLDIIKDRLYCDKANGHLRRSAQTAMSHILDSLTRLMAPILSFLAEEVSDVYQKNKKTSIHLQRLPEAIDVWREIGTRTIDSRHIAAQSGLRLDTIESVSLEMRMTGWWNILQEMRPAILKAIELKRETGEIKHSLEAKVQLFVDGSHETGQALQEFFLYLDSPEGVVHFLKDFVIVSQMELRENRDGLTETTLPWLHVSVSHVDGSKCPRCWQWDTKMDTDVSGVAQSAKTDGLCERCQKSVK